MDETAVAADDGVVAGIEGLYEARHAPLVRLAFLLTGSREAADETVQEAFIGLHARRDRVDDPAAYVRRMVVDACHGHHRRRGVLPTWLPESFEVERTLTAPLPDGLGPARVWARTGDDGEVLQVLYAAKSVGAVVHPLFAGAELSGRSCVGCIQSGTSHDGEVVVAHRPGNDTSLTIAGRGIDLETVVRLAGAASPSGDPAALDPASVGLARPEVAELPEGLPIGTASVAFAENFTPTTAAGVIQIAAHRSTASWRAGELLVALLGAPTSRGTVRSHDALLVPGRGSAGDPMTVSNSVQWIEREGLWVHVSSTSIELDTLVRVAEGLREVSQAEWDALAAEEVGAPTVTGEPPAGDAAAFCATVTGPSSVGADPGTVDFAEQWRPALDVAPPEARPLLEAWLDDPADNEILRNLIGATVAFCGPAAEPDPPDDPRLAECPAAADLPAGDPDELDRLYAELIRARTACLFGASPETVTPPE